MPTGYTAGLKEETPLEEFVMRCSRAMGALVMMRDEPMDAPIPERFEPSDYHLKALENTKAEISRLESLTESELEAECTKQHEEAESRKAEQLKENQAQIRAYRSMIKKVNAWEPPTAHHDQFKAFMIEQLERSIKFDDSSKYLKPESKPDAEAWWESTKAKLYKDMEYHTDQYGEELKRTEQRNAWLQVLRDSLK